MVCTPLQAISHTLALSTMECGMPQAIAMTLPCTEALSSIEKPHSDHAAHHQEMSWSFCPACAAWCTGGSALPADITFALTPSAPVHIASWMTRHLPQGYSSVPDRPPCHIL
jgi:hypothetical protein